jgi:ATP-citrate lyase alpha-subunit
MRRPTALTSTISDERGEELTYNKIPVTDFVDKGSIANVIGHLRFKQQLPDYALDFLNTAIILMADHGPAVSGATNTIVTARAGKDVVDSLAAWLLTIGPRFGGAVSGAGQYFFQAVQAGQSAEQFISSMKKQGIYIPGIGHKIKSIYNPDKRCNILFALSKKFPQTKYLDFAKQVEALTVIKKPNLILNVDGHVAALLLDMMEAMSYTPQQIQQYINADVFNALFVLARSIGFIGHHIDQKRLGEWLYRTPVGWYFIYIITFYDIYYPRTNPYITQKS